MAFSAIGCLFVAVLLVDRASALTCYSCNAIYESSNSSAFSACLRDPTSARNQTCLPSEDICQSLLIDLSWLRLIERRCANSTLCETIQNSSSTTGSQCCAQDLCNDGLVPTTLAPTTTTRPTTVVTTTITTTTTPPTPTTVTTTTTNPTTNAPTDDRYVIYIVVIGVLAGLLVIMTIVAVCFCVKYRKTVNKPHPVIQVREYEPGNNNQNIDTSFSDIKSTKFDYAYRPYMP